jgi:tetratricopeptide (TPR) repeat protein
MYLRTLSVAACLLGLAGCAAPPAAPTLQSPWPDQAFGWNAGAVTVTRADLFRLDADLQQKLQDPAVRDQPQSHRLKYVLSLIFGADRQGFGYIAGHSTPAAETWQRKQGDCLSLTVLTYSVGRALAMPVQMQEVRVPSIYDRRGTLDVVNQHVNVLFQRAHRQVLEDSEARDVVVDFEPEFATGQRGKPLSEDAILARYYNNVAVEHLARGQRDLAYAHFKAAMLAEPGYAAPYGNMAVLYRQAGLERDAEQLLRQAVALSDPADVPLHALHQLLIDQGRDAEARRYAQMLDALRARDPYYWIGQGLKYLQEGQPRRAIDALERARDIAAGFAEVHRHLAVAYARAGEPAKAHEQLTVLASLGAGEGKLSALRKKIHRANP